MIELACCRNAGVASGAVARTYQGHALAEDVDDGLVIDGGGVGEEEVGEGDVEEGDGGDDGLCCDEGHGCGLGGLESRGVACNVACRVSRAMVWCGVVISFASRVSGG